MTSAATLMPARREKNGRSTRAKRPPTQAERDKAHREAMEIKRLDIVGVAKNNPDRRGDESPLRAFPVGRLRKEGLITAIQYRACERFASLTGRYYRLHSLPTGNYDVGVYRMSKPVYGENNEGASQPRPERTDQEIADDNARTDADYEAMDSCLSDLFDNRQAQSALWRVAFQHLEPSLDQLGNLRIGANALARMWKIHGTIDE